MTVAALVESSSAAQHAHTAALAAIKRTNATLRVGTNTEHGTTRSMVAVSASSTPSA